MRNPYLVYSATDCAVQYATDQQALHVPRLNVELTRNKLDLDAGVRLDQLNQHLRPNVPQQVLDMLPDESVLHYGLPVHLSYMHHYYPELEN